MRRARFTVMQSAKLILALGWSDFILKYRGSILGYLWSLLVPLSRFIVILIVLRPLIATGDESYPLSLLLGLLLWDFFASATTACINALKEKSDLIQRIAFPRIIIEISAVWTQCIVIACHLILFMILIVSMGGTLTLSSLLILPIVIMLAGVSLGIGTFLASLSLKYRDIPHLWQSALQILFWLTPVAYPASSLLHAIESFHGFPPLLRSALIDSTALQPVAIIIELARGALLHSTIPDLSLVLSAGSIGLLILCMGITMFLVRSPRFLEEI